MLALLFFIFMVYMYTWNQEGLYVTCNVYAEELKEAVRNGFYFTTGILTFIVLLGV